MVKRRELGDVGTKLLLENDRVKIWELDLKVGESSRWHKHLLDYITVGLTEGGRMHREFDDGTEDETRPSWGDCRFAEKHQAHTVTNIGSTRHRNILIELKD